MHDVRVIDDVGQLESMRDEWRDLLGRAAFAEPAMTPTWLLAWWRQFGDADRRRLRVVVVEDGSRLIGLAPLSLRTILHRRALPVRSVELLATGEDPRDEICSEGVGVVVEAGRETDVADALVGALVAEKLGAWDELRMSAMSAEDPMVEALRVALSRANVTTTTAPCGEAPYIPLPSSYDEYLKQLDSSHRYVVVRALRELEKWTGKGGYTLRRATTREELDEGRRILLSLHGERWGREGKEGVFVSERFTRFHDELMPALLDERDGSIDLLWLEANGEPIAATYNFVYRGKVHFYQSGRKIDVPKQVRPGIALHALAIQAAIAAGHREYDFMSGALQYKKQLALATRTLVSLRGVAPTFRARVVVAIRTVVERVADRVRRSRIARSAAAKATAETP